VRIYRFKSWPVETTTGLTPCAAMYVCLGWGGKYVESSSVLNTQLDKASQISHALKAFILPGGNNYDSEAT